MDYANDNTMLALTFFEFVMVCVGLFYTILESNRQKKGEYSILAWGLTSYFAALIIEILGNPNISAETVLVAPIWSLVSNAFTAGGILILTYGLVAHRLLERQPYVQMLKYTGAALGFTFIVIGIVSLLVPDAMSGPWTNVVAPSGLHGILLGEWLFALLEAFLLVYALITLITHVKQRSIYAQGFFLFLAFGTLSDMGCLMGDSFSETDILLPMILGSLVDPLGFLFLVMAINHLIAEDLQRLNLQLLRRTNLLEEATRSLTKLNLLSTNLLKTTHIPDIVEVILSGLADEFGFTHTFLLLLDRHSNMLRGIRLDSNNRSYHFMDIDVRHEHFLKDAMLRGKSLFFGDGTRMPDRDFINNYNLSKNLVTVPLLTKKEKTCFDMHGCDKVSCPVQAFGWNACWLCREECPFYDGDQIENIADCVHCPAFNLVGLLIVDNRNPKNRVEEKKNIAFLETFANQAGMALHNAMLVEDLSREITFRERTFKSLPNGVMVLDESGLILSLNPSLLDILGMENEDVTGIPFEAVRLVNLEEKFHGIVNTVLEEGKSYEGMGESWTLTLPGSTLKLNIKVNPLPGTRGRHGAVILFEDITDVTALQEQLFRSEQLATLGQMAAGIAHEVNNPLAGVSGFLQVMAGRLPVDSPERSAMEAALSNIKRASGTIKDLLKFARLGPAQKRATRLNEIIKESLVFIQFQKEHQGIEIRTDFRDGLPDVVVDPDQMRQVFTNLVLNALQAMGDAGRLEVTTVTQNGMVRTFIEDTGGGIPEDNIELIFEPWFTTKQAKGTGLGLLNSDRIVSDHNGILAFSSVDCEGTTFIVDLPGVEEGS